MLTHEMGHVFGLKHCYYFSCAMNESTSIFQAAAQPLFLCPICLRKLQKVLKFDILERYLMLTDQCLQLAHVTVTPLDSPNVERLSNGLEDGKPEEHISNDENHNNIADGGVLAKTVESVFIPSASLDPSLTPPITHINPSLTPPIISRNSSLTSPGSSSSSRKSSLLHTLSSVSSETFPQSPSQYFEDAHKWFERASSCVREYQSMH